MLETRPNGPSPQAGCAGKNGKNPGLVSSLRTRVSLKPGRPGTRELLARYGLETPKRLCRQRIVEVRVDWQEAQVRRAVKERLARGTYKRRVRRLR